VSQAQGTTDQFLEKYVYSVASHQELLDKIGASKLMRLRAEDTLKEGYV
jgi:hypothetical protein